MERTDCHAAIFETAAGFCGMAWNGVGITHFQLPTRRAEEATRLVQRRAAGAERGEPTPEVARVIEMVKAYFDRRHVDFTDVVLDLRGQDDAFRRIYHLVRQLGWGETTSYGKVAKDLGMEPQFARDVGQAMAKNPIPLLIPCHRVLAANGKVGGFSAPGGTTSKLRMLEIEGVRLPQSEPAQGSLNL